MKFKKSKSSTIIIALSVLLILSLTATVALAYFSASRVATTTITFGPGISLEVSNIRNIGTNESPNNIWLTDFTNQDSAVVNAGSSPIQLREIGVKVTGADAFIAVKATITNIGGVAVAPVMASNWGKVGDTDWYVYGYDGAGYAEKMQTATPDSDYIIAVNPKTIGTSGSMNAYAGAAYVCTVEIHASDDIQGLETIINADIDGDLFVGIPQND